MKQSVLITGCGGFLGSHLAEKFLLESRSVVGIDNFCTGVRDNRKYLEGIAKSKEDFLFFEADVTQDWNWWNQIPTSIRQSLQFIFHFASPASPPHYQRLAKETLWVNSLGLENCLKAADSVGARVIYASTSEIYGDPLVHPQKEEYWGNVNTMGPRSCYDEAKRFGESLLYSHNEKFKTKHGLVRIFNTYGPRMNLADGRVIINLLTQALTDKPLTVYGQGKQTRSFCYVDDLIAGICAYAATSSTLPVNVGNPNEFTILELAEKIVQMFPQRKLKIEFLPLPKDDPQQRRPDLTRALELLKPWSPKIPLEVGLQKLSDWLQQDSSLRKSS